MSYYADAFNEPLQLNAKDAGFTFEANEPGSEDEPMREEVFIVEGNFAI